MNPENNDMLVHKQMKVYYGEYDESGRCLLPVIRIRGKHLIRYGFQVGDAISVFITKGEINIKKIPQNAEDTKSGSP